MIELIGRIEQALADLLQSGLSTRASAAAPELHELAEECERMGLHTGCALLTELENALVQRSHTIIKDDMPITAVICRIVKYLELCKEKMQEELIERQWQDDIIKEENLKTQEEKKGGLASLIETLDFGRKRR